MTQPIRWPAVKRPLVAILRGVKPDEVEGIVEVRASAGDNRLGGWYAYRASKAALNMLVKTAAVELRRTHPGACIAALHPGTVKSALSRPFRGDEIGVEPAVAAQRLLQVVDQLGVRTLGLPGVLWCIRRARREDDQQTEHRRTASDERSQIHRPHACA